MSLQEMLEQVETLSAEDRQTLRLKLNNLEDDLTPEEHAYLDEVMADFDPNNIQGFTFEQMLADCRMDRASKAKL